MADEIRIDRSTADRDVTVPLPNAAAAAGVASAEPVTDTDDPQVVRAEIEQTRARMSETIDDIEEVLARKKEQIQDRLDVLSPVRENPWPAVGIVFGTGLLLGLLTGGGDDDDEDDRRDVRRFAGRDGDEDEAYWQRRAEMWEERARRLLRIAQEQEETIDSRRERAPRFAAELDDDESDESVAERVRSSADDLREMLAHGLTQFFQNAMRQLVGSAR